ncbi:3-oxoacyl-[acyl-carrier protein] reductase [Actinacidiphila yanglinensis]|uniref:3-oxoacyl-[acyl-carrier protein] reductase n=1 Tax=Actinacidiphila yanglinensis TaxID=310779 RepID=A0A1H6C6N5_9ACTN|nr:SDR family oxidoreductase [Actinacidiphila yanglinensis]SEG68631.1 3-oxoacyl-[acyl-carrier protein] reductase [Actinacidiphila yanglinensis]
MAAVAIFCGAGRAAGDAIAGRLAEEGFDLAVLGPSAEAGAHVVAHARRVGRRALALAVRPHDAGSVQQAVDQVDGQLGPPAVLLNVVEARLGAPLHEVPDWDACVGGLLRESFLISQAVLDPMIREGRGRIVTVADVLCGPGQRENTTVRAGLEGFTRTLAMEADVFGVTANLVVAGLGVRAPAAAEILPSAPGSPASGFPAAGQEVAAAELAATVAFLAGDAAAIMSGQVIHVGAADPVA